MCKFKSAIVVRDDASKGGFRLLMSPWTESHEDLVTYCKLKDNDAFRINFARVEFSPSSMDKAHLVDEYKLRLDEDRAPDWWSDEIRDGVAAKMRDYIKSIIVTGNVGLLMGGQFILAPGAKVEASRAVVIAAMCGTSSVGTMSGTSSVGTMSGTSSVGKMLDTSSVGEMLDTSSVGMMRDTSSVGKMYGTSSVREMYGTSSVREMCGTSSVGTMSGTSSVREMCGTSSVGTMSGTSSVREMWDTSSVGMMLDTSSVGMMLDASKSPRDPRNLASPAPAKQKAKKPAKKSKSK